MDILEHNNYPINEELVKKIQVFLGGYKYIEHDEKIPGNERKIKNIETFRKYNNLEFISESLGLELKTIYLMLCKTLKYEGYRTSDLEFSADSSVFKIKGTNKVLKIYFHLGKQIIERYHKIQNQIANRNYCIDINGELNGKKFDRIEFDIHNLPLDGIVGTKDSCISIIPEVKAGIEVEDDFSQSFDINTSITNPIIREINRVNNINISENSLHLMNLTFHKVEEGTLYVTITDLGNIIKQFLNFFEKEESKKTSNLKQTIVGKIFSLLRIQKK